MCKIIKKIVQKVTKLGNFSYQPYPFTSCRNSYTILEKGCLIEKKLSNYALRQTEVLIKKGEDEKSNTKMQPHTSANYKALRLPG